MLELKSGCPQTFRAVVEIVLTSMLIFVVLEPPELVAVTV